MSMSVGSPDGDSGDNVMVEMNTTPLIDVMLVLLIMLILNIPMQTHASKLDNPPPTPPLENPPPVVKHEVGVTFENQILYDGAPIQLSALADNFRQISAQPKDQQPEIHLRPDKYSKYEVVAKIVAAAQLTGITKMGFVGNEAYIN
jgi:biopolymer transport protein ExbD